MNRLWNFASLNITVSAASREDACKIIYDFASDEFSMLQINDQLKEVSIESFWDDSDSSNFSIIV